MRAERKSCCFDSLQGFIAKATAIAVCVLNMLSTTPSFATTPMYLTEWTPP